MPVPSCKTRSGWALMAGAALGVTTDRFLVIKSDRRRVPASAAILLAAAAIYPLSDRIRGRDAGVFTREASAITAAVGLMLIVQRLPDRPARAVTAAGWLLHAAFDQVHERGTRSRLPNWYPALCAGYDVAMAAMLSRAPTPAAAT